MTANLFRRAELVVAFAPATALGLYAEEAWLVDIGLSDAEMPVHADEVYPLRIDLVEVV